MNSSWYIHIFNHTLVISIVVPLVDSTFHLQLYQLPSDQMVNTMLQKTIQIQLLNTYSDIANEQYYAWPTDLDIMKCLVSKEHFLSLSGGI